MGVNGQNLEVYLDDDRFPAGNLPALKKGWQSVGLTDTKSYGQKPISLSEGKHTVTFRCKGSVAPHVDFIRLVRNKADSVISDTDYQNYMNMLKSSSLPATYIETEGGEEKAVSSSATSQADYAYELDISFSYTYFGSYYLNSGQTVVFETKNPVPGTCDPVMYLFNSSDPISRGSWPNNDGTGKTFPGRNRRRRADQMSCRFRKTDRGILFWQKGSVHH